LPDTAKRFKIQIFPKLQSVASNLVGASRAYVFNAAWTGDGRETFNHASKLGLEGIVSKRITRLTAPEGSKPG
jgi:ATP-dependent DNA ligase